MAKLLTDQQLDLLADGIMAKVRAKEAQIAMQHAKHPKLNLAPLRKAAEAYLKERNRVIAVSAPVHAFMVNTYATPDNIDLSDFDKFQKEVDTAYSRQKSGYRTKEQLDTLRQTVKAEILRNSLTAAELDKVLADIENKYA